MQTSDGTQANRDGSVNVPPGATLDSSAYTGRGSAHLAVTAHLLAAGPPVEIEVRFDGDVVGTMSVDSTIARTWEVALDLSDSRPRAIRLKVASGIDNAPVLRIEKVVLRQP
jgi:hypothetical protein